MPAAVFMGLRDVAVEDGPTPIPGPDELLLEVSHCGICGSDLHFLLEWGGRDERRSRATSTRAPSPRSAPRSRAGRSATGRSAGRAPSAASASTASPAGRALHRAGPGRGRRQRLAGRVRRYKTVTAADALRVPDGLSLKHAALTEPLAVALHGITRGGGARPGHALAGDGRRADRVPVGRRAEGARRRRHRRERAHGTPARAVREARRAHGRRPTSSSRRRAARPRRRAVRRRARVLGQRTRRRSRRSRS